MCVAGGWLSRDLNLAQHTAVAKGRDWSVGVGSRPKFKVALWRVLNVHSLGPRPKRRRWCRDTKARTGDPSWSSLPSENTVAEVGFRPARDPNSVRALTDQVVDQAAQLMRDELALARLEMKGAAKRLTRAGLTFGLAGGLAFFGAAALTAGAILGLCNVVRPWFAALIVGGVLFVAAGLTVLPGRRGIVGTQALLPRRSMESVKNDLGAVKDALRTRPR